MAARKLPKSLASIAPSACVVSIFEEGRPEKSGLKHCNTPKYTLVVSDMFRAFCKLNLTVS